MGVLLQGFGISELFLIVPFLLSILAIFLKKGYYAILIFSFMAGFIISLAGEPSISSGRQLQYKELDYSGVVEEVSDFDYGQSFIVRIDSADGKAIRPIKTKAFMPSSLPEVMETDKISFVTVLEPLDSSTGFPDEIDYDTPLRRRGIMLSCFIAPDDMKVTGEEGGILNSIRRFSFKIRHLIASSSLSSFSKELLIAMLTGDRTLLSVTTRENFSSIGLSHILALSGLHVGILCAILSLMLFPLLSMHLNWLKVIIILIFLWIFAVMTGLSPSVVRSVIMATVYFISLLSERVRSPFNSLCFAALIILVFNPSSLYEIGFQMSFIALASIMLFAEKLNPVSRKNKFWYGFFAYPSVTLAAMLCTAILSAWYFHIFPVYFIPSNFIASLLLPFLLSGGIVYVLFLAVGLDIGLIAKFIDLLSGFLNTINEFLLRLPFLKISDVYITPISLFAWFMALGALALFLYRRRKVYIFSALALALMAFADSAFLRPVYGEKEIFIMKGGRNTSMLINDGKRLHLISTAPVHEHQWIADTHNSRCLNYRLKHRLDTIRPLEVQYVSKFIQRKNEFVKIGDRGFLLLSSNDYPEIPGLDYAVVCRGFRGDILQLYTDLSPDSIILSEDLDKRRHDRYADELREACVPYRSLRESLFRLRLK